jgi:molybdate transport system substrate-binding protein
MRWLLAFLMVLSMGVAARAQTVKVAAAISLREAMTRIAADYHQSGGAKIELTFGASGQLMAQIRSGAPIDVFISAADEEADELIRAGLAEKASRQVIAHNTLVLIVPAGSEDAIASFDDLKKPAVKRIAIGEPTTVPAGRYAAQALEAMKLQDAVAKKLVYGGNVRQVLSYVERGEVSAGIVYSTDARQAGGQVKVVATAKASTHSPIEYPAVIIKDSDQQQAAKAFVRYLKSPEARAVLREKGFAAEDAKESTTRTATP